MTIRDLAIELLTQDGGISQKAYEILHEMLNGDDDITQHVEATDGRFYLPDGWEPNADHSFDKSYLMSKVHTITPDTTLETDENVGEAAWRLKQEFDLPEDWQFEVYSWLSDHRDRALENRDDQGGCPDQEDLEATFVALGYQLAT